MWNVVALACSVLVAGPLKPSLIILPPNLLLMLSSCSYIHVQSINTPEHCINFTSQLHPYLLVPSLHLPFLLCSPLLVLGLQMH